MVDRATRNALPRALLSLGLAVLFSRPLGCGGESIETRRADDTGGTRGIGDDDDAGGTSGSGRGGTGGISITGGRGGTIGVGTGATGGVGGTRAGEGGEATGGDGGGVSCSDEPPLDLDPPTTRRPWLDAGRDHTCLLKRDGTVVCWGANAIIFDGEDLYTDSAVPPTGTFTRLSTNSSSCALDAEGRATCWGGVNAGDDALRDVSPEWFATAAIRTDGSFIYRGTSGTFPAGPFVAVESDEWFACLLAQDGNVTCLDYHRVDGAYVPPPLCGRFVDISAAAGKICGLKADATIECASRGTAPGPVGTHAEVAVGGLQTCTLRRSGGLECWGGPTPPNGSYVQVSAGASHACALRSDDKVICWGSNDAFQLDPPPDIAAESNTFTKISVGGAAIIFERDQIDGDFPFDFRTNACGLLIDGSISCWGSAGTPPVGSFDRVVTGYGPSCAIRNDGTLDCWGSVLRGGVGLPPGRVTSGQVLDLSYGFRNACAVMANGELTCWQGAQQVQGQPPFDGTYLRVAVSSAVHEGTSEIYEHGCALRSNRDVVCWGYVGSPGVREVAGPFVDIAAGNMDCALRADGSLVCWQPDPLIALTPIAGTFTKISGPGTMHALRSDGSVTTIEWGGVLTTPIDDTFVDLSAAYDFACGLRMDGHVRCWGSRVR